MIKLGDVGAVNSCLRTLSSSPPPELSSSSPLVALRYSFKLCVEVADKYDATVPAGDVADDDSVVIAQGDKVGRHNTT